MKQTDERLGRKIIAEINYHSIYQCLASFGQERDIGKFQILICG
jgi:hypothetical protein